MSEQESKLLGSTKEILKEIEVFLECFIPNTTDTNLLFSHGSKKLATIEQTLLTERKSKELSDQETEQKINTVSAQNDQETLRKRHIDDLSNRALKLAPE